MDIIIFLASSTDRQGISNVTNDIELDSVMSLSAIAQALKNSDDDTPRKLVDQLLLARKNDKLKKLVGKTYTVPERSSIPIVSSVDSRNTLEFEDLNFSSKLSLHDPSNEVTHKKHSLPTKSSLVLENKNKGRNISHEEAFTTQLGNINMCK